MTRFDKEVNTLYRALGFWTLGVQYLHLAESAAMEVVTRGNVHFMVFDGVWSDEQDAEFEEATKWADHSLGVPVIFNFYHGLELCLKGLLCGQTDGPLDHNLTKLLDRCTSVYGPESFLCLAEKYIIPSKMIEPVHSFLQDNDIGINSWYEALRYPESRTGKPINDRALKYRGRNGVAFFDQLGQDIQEFRVGLVAFTKKIHTELS